MRLYTVILTPIHSGKYLIDKIPLSKFHFSNWHHVSVYKAIPFSNPMLKIFEQLIYCGSLKIYIFKIAMELRKRFRLNKNDNTPY